jgi:hypothetical protein
MGLCIVLIIYVDAYAAELGDYCVDDHRDYYLSEFRFIPGQPESFEREVAEMHKQHRYAKFIRPAVSYSYR